MKDKVSFRKYVLANETMRNDGLTFCDGEYDGHEVVVAYFEIVRGDVLRVTKEYNLTYVPETREWFGDVIAYGQWRDIDQGEIAQLRLKYDLDSRTQDYLGGKVKQ